jgi:hypothetical protein
LRRCNWFPFDNFMIPRLGAAGRITVLFSQPNQPKRRCSRAHATQWSNNMVSKRQLEANRLNARRSSGPRTQEGKRRARMNALRHGLTAKNIVIGDEDPKEFEDLRAKLEHDLQPKTALEGELLERLAGLLWRLRRVPAIEAAIVNARQDEIYSQASENLAADKRRRAEKRPIGNARSSSIGTPLRFRPQWGPASITRSSLKFGRLKYGRTPSRRRRREPST